MFKVCYLNPFPKRKQKNWGSVHLVSLDRVISNACQLLFTMKRGPHLWWCQWPFFHNLKTISFPFFTAIDSVNYSTRNDASLARCCRAICETRREEWVTKPNFATVCVCLPTYMYIPTYMYLPTYLPTSWPLVAISACGTCHSRVLYGCCGHNWVNAVWRRGMLVCLSLGHVVAVCGWWWWCPGTCCRWA